MANEQETTVHGTFKFRGNAAKIIKEAQAERLMANKPHSAERTITILLCEMYNKKHGKNEGC